MFLMRNRSLNSERKGPVGATLLEVLVCVSLIGFGVGALLTGMAVVTRGQSRMEDRIVARRLAEGLALQAQTGVGLAEEGAFEAPFEDYRWTAAMREMEGLGEDMNAAALELAVWRRRGAEDALLSRLTAIMGGS